MVRDLQIMVRVWDFILDGQGLSRIIDCKSQGWWVHQTCNSHTQEAEVVGS